MRSLNQLAAHDQSDLDEQPPQAPILVVDDDAANLFAVRETLANLGQPLVCAQSGEEALRQVLEHDFALILLDVSMPGMDGYETAALIRARKKSCQIPIIFLSAVNKDPSHLFRGYSAGAVDYVFKPVPPEILRSKVAVFIELHNKIAEVRRQAELEKELLKENLNVRKKQSRTEEALYRSEQQQSLVLQSLPLALYLSSYDDGFQSRKFVGGSTQNLCGLAPVEFSRTRKIWLSRIHDDDRPIVVEALELAAKTGSFYAEYRWRCADGSFRWFSDRGTVVPAKGGSLELFGIWLDVSERHTLQQQLAHAQRIEAIGRMTGGIAHDFNNMISVIFASLEHLQRSDIDDPKSVRRIGLALKATRSCSDMTKRLLGFARQQNLEPVLLAVKDEIEGISDLLHQSIGDNIELKIECPEKIWPVYIDRSQLESAVVNLVVNACDAMPQGGRIGITVANKEISGKLASELEVSPGSYVEIAVSDTGTGMSEDVLQRAFEPFFTTKSIGQGTGLGLSTIYGFLKQSEGAVKIETELGSGTTIRLFLPRSLTAFAGEADISSRPAGMATDTLTVLVVEDEHGVREMAVSMLEDIGWEAIEAADAAQALRCLEENPSISLLFSDCMMPGELDGPGLAEEVMRRQPEMTVLLTSAYGCPDGKNPKFGFLPKPYGPSDLENAIRQLVNQPDI